MAKHKRLETKEYFWNEKGASATLQLQSLAPFPQMFCRQRSLSLSSLRGCAQHTNDDH